MKIADVVAMYVGLRDERAAWKKQWSEGDAVFAAKMDKIEAKLLEVFDKTGVDSTKTEHGTAYVSTRTSASIADKEAFMNFVKSEEEWPLLEIRVAKLAVEQYKEEHQELPPGINWGAERVVNIRRSA